MIAFLAGQIATSRATPQQSHLQNSGVQTDWSINFINWNISKDLRLEKSQPEPILQPECTIPGKMAARDQRNLWKHHDRLYKQTWGAVETYVPKRVDGRKGVVGLSYSGPDSKNISLMCFLRCLRYRREVPSTMPMKRILLWWTFSLEAQLPLVKIHLLNKYQISPFYSEFERSKRMTWLDFIANLGGLCGLCLGISFVSVVELAYWFIIRLSENCLKKPL